MPLPVQLVQLISGALLESARQEVVILRYQDPGVTPTEMRSLSWPDYAQIHSLQGPGHQLHPRESSHNARLGRNCGKLPNSWDLQAEAQTDRLRRGTQRSWLSELKMWEVAAIASGKSLPATGRPQCSHRRSLWSQPDGGSSLSSAGAVWHH